MAQGGYRVGVDVGGTFTDLICITPDGQVVLDKTPTGWCTVVPRPSRRYWPAWVT